MAVFGSVVFGRYGIGPVRCSLMWPGAVWQVRFVRFGRDGGGLRCDRFWQARLGLFDLGPVYLGLVHGMVWQVGYGAVAFWFGPA